VTLTGRTENGKRLINSNVAVELGYAIGIHGDAVLLKVMNTHFASPKHLPFDLAHRRWPIQYQLPPAPSPEVREQVRGKLASDLRSILEDYIRANQPAPVSFAPTPPTINAATYWEPSEALASIGDALFSEKIKPLKFDPAQALIYLRIWPDQVIPALSNQLLNSEFDKSVIEPLCGTISGWSNERNRYGRIAFAYDNDKTLYATTQVFKNGEIWGINHRMLRQRADRPNFIPIVALEQGIGRSFHKYIHIARSHFGYGSKIHFEFGLVNVSGYRLALADNSLSDEIFDDVKVVGLLDEEREDAIDMAKTSILRGVYEAAGLTWHTA
jgi:hypothetical protein